MISFLHRIISSLKNNILKAKIRELKLITKHLDKELKKLSNKINSLQGVIEKGSREDEYNKLGNLLLVNLNLLKSGMEEIEVEDIYEK